MEKLMQYVWQHRLFPASRLATVDGRRVRVINPGLLNTGAGPDFFNASIEIDGQQWAGNVEIHVRASDWHRHGHDADPAYDSVILHVVDADDTAICRSDGQVIPQMRMPCSPTLNTDFHRLTDAAPVELPCAQFVRSLPSLYLSDWISTLGLERLQMKASRINDLLEANAGAWDETAYITLARSLGFSINAEPFERLARSLPLKFMLKHADSLTAVEALLFGQAGMLRQPTDSYAAHLASEYRFLAQKFGLAAPEHLGWKMARMRPQNFPFRRIALLAAIIHRGFTLMADIPAVKTADDAATLISTPLSGYWANHFSFGAAETANATRLSQSSVNTLVINTIAPLMYAYGIARGDNGMASRAIDILHHLKAESNSVVALFAAGGIKAPDAFTSQALIQLRREYCEKRKCLYCRFGHRQLARVALRPEI